MTTKVLDGRLMRLTFDGEKLIYATNSSLSIAVEVRETANKDVGGGWKSGETGQKSWTLSAEGQYSHDSAVDGEARANAETFFDLVNEGDAVAVEFITGVEGDVMYTGQAILTSLQYDFPNNENSTWSVSGEGVGKLNKAVVPPA